MTYDETLDEEIVKKELNRGHYKYVISLHSYNEGPIKLQINRINVLGTEEKIVHLGRISKEDLEDLLPLIEGLIPRMDKEDKAQAKLKNE